MGTEKGIKNQLKTICFVLERREELREWKEERKTIDK